MKRSLGPVLAGTLVCGCYTGVFAGPDAAPESGADTGDEAESADDGGGDDGAGQGDACGADETLAAIGPSPMARLTRIEYDHAVRDLLGVDAQPGAILPEDDHVGPFASNTIIDVPEHTVRLYGELAQGLAADAVDDLEALLPCEASAGVACAQAFILDFGRRAYRRPIAPDELDRLLEVYAVGAEVDAATGIRLVLEAILQSPHFLYRVESGTPTSDPQVIALDAWSVASRLSFFLWRSIPDEALLAAAEDGEIDEPEGLRAQAERMLADPRAAEAIASFHRQWLHLEGSAGLDALSKDPELFGELTPTLVQAMSAEVDAFVGYVWTERDASLRELLTARYTFANAELAALYGVAGPAGDELVRVDLPPTQRIGLFTQAGVLATQAGYSQTSPTLRGKLVRESLLCESLPPPPPDVNDALPPKGENETKKQQLEAHMSDPSCAACHVMMDPIGFGFESYDPIGRHRTMDGAFAVDATGEVVSDDESIAGPFDGAIELLERLSGSERVGRCMARQWARFALGREVSPTEATCSTDLAYARLVTSDDDLRALMVELVMLDAFRQRRLPTP